MPLNLVLIEADIAFCERIRRVVARDPEFRLLHFEDGLQPEREFLEKADVLFIRKPTLTAEIQAGIRQAARPSLQIVLIGGPGDSSFAKIANISRTVEVEISENALETLLRSIKLEQLELRARELTQLLAAYSKGLKRKSNNNFAFPCRPDEVEWVEAKANYVVLHTSENAHVVRLTMNVAAETLEPKLLIRIHRKWMVNILRVAAAEGNSSDGGWVTTFSGKRLRVSVKFWRSLVELLPQVGIHVSHASSFTELDNCASSGSL